MKMRLKIEELIGFCRLSAESCCSSKCPKFMDCWKDFEPRKDGTIEVVYN